MDLEIKSITTSLSSLSLNENKIIKIQKWFRGCILRLHQLPLIMYKIKKYLQSQVFNFSNQNRDGRINSCIDEDVIIKLLVEKFNEKIKEPKIRMWYDILVFDNMYGWLPVNIKTTTTITSDNTGNLAMCVYAYTNEVLDIHSDNTYENGKMSEILFYNLQMKKYNIRNKKDYYFIVLNKSDTKDIIINSVKGLTYLTPNINNLPFQVCWKKNKTFQYENINKKINLFINCLQYSKPSWKETFIQNIRTLKLEKTKKELGQYFTTNNELKEKVFSFILNSPSNILEPSIGRGDLIRFIIDKIPDITFDMYEIDSEIKLLNKIEKNKVMYCDFMKQTITKTYKTIIGNPPYVKTKKGNLYIDFIEKCYNLLDNNGELIFIVPSDFLKLTSASKLLNEMMLMGTFTHIFHNHNEKMFKNASIDVIVFRYCKDNVIDKKVLYNNKLLYIKNNNGLITFEEKQNNNNILFKDYFDIYVGLVSGKEEVYKNEKLGNIRVINGKDKIDKYIYIKNYPCDNEEINKYLFNHKKELIERGIRKFNENNWFEWGALRNIKSINNNLGKDCIYIYNLTRQENVSFLGKVNYFGGGLIMLKPKKECNLENIISYINSNKFRENFTFSGRFKIGHRQISNSSIPFQYL